jgi:Yip1 domain
MLLRRKRKNDTSRGCNMQLILLTLFKPRRAAEQIKASPRWLTTFLLLSAVSIVTTAIMHPFVIQRTLAHLPPSAAGSDKQAVTQFLNLEMPATLWFLPVRLFTGWGSFSLVLFSVARAFELKKTVRFQQTLSLIIHTGTVSVIAGVATLCIAATDSGNPLLTAPFSLAAFGETFLARSLLGYVSLFTMWEVWIQVIGISVLCEFGARRSIVVVLMVWVLTILFNISVLKLLMDRFHFLV